jgi:RNA polymerase sigma factor (TIGR02999 family)
MPIFSCYDSPKMASKGSEEITALLAAWGQGDEGALDGLMSAMYPELRRIARLHLLRQRPGQSLESAALANEAYLKLTGAGALAVENRVHFLALCSQIIRRILVDHARSRNYAKRGGDAARVTLDEAIPGQKPRDIEVLALDEALGSLAKIDWRKVRVIELRYFGGLNIDETAGVLGISAETAKRDWRMAKAWLFARLSGDRTDQL